MSPQFEQSFHFGASMGDDITIRSKASGHSGDGDIKERA